MSYLGRCISSILIEYFLQIKGTRLLQSSKSRRLNRQYSTQSILQKRSLQTRAAKLFFFLRVWMAVIAIIMLIIHSLRCFVV